MTSIPLRRLQRWFAACVEYPGTAAQALANESVQRLLPAAHVASGRVLAANPRMTPAMMLQVYNDGYFARLFEVMCADFPAVQHVLGADRFRAVVARYIATCPSRHANLNRFGARFPAFVRGEPAARSAFVAEVAHLERALSDAFDAPTFTPLPPDALQQVPQDRWGETRFTANPSLQLLAFRYPVDTWYSAWQNGEAAAVPCTQHSWLAVYRSYDRVHRLRLVRPAFSVLQALVAGEPLAAALALARGGEPVAAWFREFAQAGLFVALE